MSRKFAALNEISREFSFSLNDISFGQNESWFALNDNLVGQKGKFVCSRRYFV